MSNELTPMIDAESKRELDNIASEISNATNMMELAKLEFIRYVGSRLSRARQLLPNDKDFHDWRSLNFSDTLTRESAYNYRLLVERLGDYPNEIWAKIGLSNCYLIMGKDQPTVDLIVQTALAAEKPLSGATVMQLLANPDMPPDFPNELGLVKPSEVPPAIAPPPFAMPPAPAPAPGPTAGPDPVDEPPAPDPGPIISAPDASPPKVEKLWAGPGAVPYYVENDETCRRAGYMAFKLNMSRVDIIMKTGIPERHFDVALAFAYGYEEGRKDPRDIDE